MILVINQTSKLKSNKKQVANFIRRQKDKSEFINNSNAKVGHKIYFFFYKFFFSNVLVFNCKK